MPTPAYTPQKDKRCYHKRRAAVTYRLPAIVLLIPPQPCSVVWWWCRVVCTTTAPLTALGLHLTRMLTIAIIATLINLFVSTQVYGNARGENL